jgi:tripartite ATP-independent transporter DctM subunit
MVTAIGFACVFIALASGVPVGAALALIGMFGIIGLTGHIAPAFVSLGLVSFRVTSTFEFLVIPLFVLLGLIALKAEISDELFSAAQKILGKIPGGLAIGTCFACAGFAAITGSSIATAVAMTKVALPPMLKQGYNRALAVGVIASAGTFAIMIPPSIVLVVYGILAEQSIGKLLAAGVIPGSCTAILYSLSIVVRVSLNPSLAPPSPAYPWRDKIASMKRIWPFFLIIFVIVGGIVGGIWTPTEAAGVGVILVFILGVLRRKVSLKNLAPVLVESIQTSSTILMIIIGSYLFGKFLAISGVAEAITRNVLELQLPPPALFAGLLLVYIFLGCFLEGMSMMALTLPIVLPMIATQGWDPIWFGIVMTKLIEIASVTPPVGLNLYAVKAAAPPGTEFRDIYVGSIPFWLCDVVMIILFYLFPQIVLWLPNTMIG